MGSWTSSSSISKRHKQSIHRRFSLSKKACVLLSWDGDGFEEVSLGEGRGPSTATLDDGALATSVLDESFQLLNAPWRIQRPHSDTQLRVLANTDLRYSIEACSRTSRGCHSARGCDWLVGMRGRLFSTSGSSERWEQFAVIKYEKGTIATKFQVQLFQSIAALSCSRRSVGRVAIMRGRGATPEIVLFHCALRFASPIWS